MKKKLLLPFLCFFLTELSLYCSELSSDSESSEHNNQNSLVYLWDEGDVYLGSVEKLPNNMLEFSLNRNHPMWYPGNWTTCIINNNPDIDHLVPKVTVRRTDNGETTSYALPEDEKMLNLIEQCKQAFENQ